MTSDYKFKFDSRCECGGKRYLLYNPKTFSKLPSFYICFRCEFIGESGVGEVIKRKRKG